MFGRLLDIIIHAAVLILIGAVIMAVGVVALGFIGLTNTALPVGVTGAIIYSVWLAVWKALAGVGSKVKRAQRIVDLILTPFAVWLGVIIANTILGAMGLQNAATTPPDMAFWASFSVSVGVFGATAQDIFGNGFKQVVQPRQPATRRR